MLHTLFLSAALAGTFRATALTESVAVPFTQAVPTPLHPGFAVGGALWSSKTEHFEHRVHLDGGFYHHPLVENALFLLPHWQTTAYPTRHFGLSALAGAGYKHTFYPGSTYVLRAGRYVPRRRAGHPKLTAMAGLGLAVPVSPTLSLVAQYRGHLDGPFAPATGFPVLTHIASHVGVEVTL